MTELDRGWLSFFRILFVISAIWNFAGSIPGLMDTTGMFEREFGRAMDDPVMIAVYRGAWGTAFLYGFGFLIAAKDPSRHTGIVLMGGAGKALFAINLYLMHVKGLTSSFALLVIAGDIVFVALFILYFFVLKRRGASLI